MAVHWARVGGVPDAALRPGCGGDSVGDHANGCMTASRHRALDAHLASLRSRPARRRPGSYAWPRVRVASERLFSAGVPISRVTDRVRTANYGTAEPPSERTIQRWRSQSRWVRPPPATGS